MLEVRFHDCMAGWITLTLKFEKQVESLGFSALQGDEFSNFMQWLELLLIGQNAYFEWDAESSLPKFQYEKGLFTLSKDEKCLAQCPIGRMELVRIFYEAFVSFTQSNEYRPRQWVGWCSHGASIENDIKCLLTGDEIIETFLGMNERASLEMDSKLNSNYRIRFLKEIGNGLLRFGLCLLKPCEVCKTPIPVDEPTYLELPLGFFNWDYSNQIKWLRNYWNEGDRDRGQRDLRELRFSNLKCVLQKR